METYQICGHAVEYDTFDLENMERFDRETRRVTQICQGVSDGQDYLAVAKQYAESILAFFDGVLGEGMARELFGARVNIRDVLHAYHQFSTAVAAAFAREFGDKHAPPLVPLPQTPRARIVSGHAAESV